MASISASAALSATRSHDGCFGQLIDHCFQVGIRNCQLAALAFSGKPRAIARAVEAVVGGRDCASLLCRLHCTWSPMYHHTLSVAAVQ